MKSNVERIYNDLFKRFPELSCIKEDVGKVFEIIKETYINKGKLLVCGNGGSAADSAHIVGELMKGFMLSRKLPETEKAKFKNKEISKIIALLLINLLYASVGIFTKLASQQEFLSWAYIFSYG